MSTMVHPESFPKALLPNIEKCSECEADRRPRMYVCAYHEGMWDGWEMAQQTEGDDD